MRWDILKLVDNNSSQPNPNSKLRMLSLKDELVVACWNRGTTMSVKLEDLKGHIVGIKDFTIIYAFGGLYKRNKLWLSVHFNYS